MSSKSFPVCVLDHEGGGAFGAIGGGVVGGGAGGASPSRSPSRGSTRGTWAQRQKQPPGSASSGAAAVAAAANDRLRLESELSSRLAVQASYEALAAAAAAASAATAATPPPPPPPPTSPPRAQQHGGIANAFSPQRGHGSDSGSVVPGSQAALRSASWNANSHGQRPTGRSGWGLTTGGGGGGGGGGR
eukprot:SAG22_NODE_76_length_22248_cov_14.352070_18_plen_189_part_00